jgi:TPR repeat protein
LVFIPRLSALSVSSATSSSSSSAASNSGSGLWQLFILIRSLHFSMAASAARAAVPKLLADEGDSAAQFTLEKTCGLFAYVCCIELGNGISIDFVEAAGYYKLCAGQGDHNGQLHSGLCLELGNDISTGAMNNIPAGCGPTRFEDGR